MQTSTFNNYFDAMCNFNRSSSNLKRDVGFKFDILEVKLSRCLIEWGFKCSKLDTSMLVYIIGVDMVIFLVYIDDIVIISSYEWQFLTQYDNMTRDRYEYEVTGHDMTYSILI